ncbi:hypothetical protein oki361_23670 [Helicobacter pylori]
MFLSICLSTIKFLNAPLPKTEASAKIPKSFKLSIFGYQNFKCLVMLLKSVFLGIQIICFLVPVSLSKASSYLGFGIGTPFLSKTSFPSFSKFLVINSF